MKAMVAFGLQLKVDGVDSLFAVLDNEQVQVRIAVPDHVCFIL